MQCALTKLAYLLEKPELSIAQVRALMGTPLRGELTLPPSNMPTSRSQAVGIDNSLNNIQGLLTQAVRLSITQPHTPKIVIAPPETESKPDAADSTAPWTWTAAEAALTEVALYPFLMHLSAAKDDVDGIRFCLKSDPVFNEDPELLASRNTAIRGGIVNCIDPGSGRSPLHVAALNGGIGCVEVLLETGALVHLRDNLGHTALYYVSTTDPYLQEASY